ncbi:MAG: hypothetical protein SWJ54_03795 [Cyanobacteriota bacterium]|nr:hypothetical protein [Cyanobacteriota bacterium]
MIDSRWHYPTHLKHSTTVPYQGIIPLERQIHHQSITFDYTIKTTLSRQHCNPPIWTDFHFHTFEIILELAATCQPGDLYGLDMVEMENKLYLWAEKLPEKINEHPLCPHGTTEEMCLYFAQIKLEPHVKLLRVSVSETANRVTTLKLC